jgi:hypothetical protein
MRRFTHFTTALLLAAATFFAVSCDDTEELTPTNPDDDYDAILKVKEDSTNSTPNVNVNITSTTGATITAKVTFVNTDGDGMKRLYITQNVAGTGEVAFEPLETSVNLKADGAVGLENSNADEFSFEFDLPVPDTITNGTVVYTFWTTTGNGDFRDPSQRLAAGPGTITLKFGTAVDPDAGDAPLKYFSDVQLDAPLADGTSETFVSLVDGETFNVNQGLEYVALWDIGYLYSTATSDAATLRPPYNYPTIAIDIPTKAGVTNDELNKTYLKNSTKTAAEFDAFTISSDLSFVSVAQTNDNLKAVQLDVDDVVEFIDNYGKKGVAKVLEVNGTNGSDGYIRLAIKVQP